MVNIIEELLKLHSLIRIQLTSILWHPLNVLIQAGDIKVIVVKLATLLAPHVRQIPWTIVRVAGTILDAVTSAVLAVIRRRRRIAVPV